MKKTFLALLLLSSTAMFAQNGRTNPADRSQPSNHAPAKIQQSFQKDNPNTNDARWSEGNNQWHANYKDNNNRNVDAYYDRNGLRKDTHTTLDKRDVPQNVDSRVNGRYNANGNYNVARIDRPNDQPLFQIKIQRGGSARTVYMDEQGREKRYNDHH